MSEENKIPSEKLINSIKKWVQIDDDILKIKNAMKELNNEKKEYENIVLSELDNMEEKVINISDGKLKKNINKVQGPLKKENIHKTIFEFTKDEQKTFNLIEKIMASRQTKEKICLKRIKNRESVIKKNEDIN